MTPQQIEAMKLALDLATMHHTDDGYAELRAKVRSAIKEALAQPEPVAFASHGVVNWIADKQFQHEADLYTTPPQRTEIELVGTVKELFKDSAWNRLDVRGSTKVYLDKDNT